MAPERDAELFWATAGGMGLTGVVVSAVLRLIPIETSWMKVDSQRFTRLERTMSTMEQTDYRYRYSVAWLDCTGGRNGDHRSVLTRGDHAPSSAHSGPACAAGAVRSRGSASSACHVRRPVGW